MSFLFKPFQKAPVEEAKQSFRHEAVQVDLKTLQANLNWLTHRQGLKDLPSINFQKLDINDTKDWLVRENVLRGFAMEALVSNYAFEEVVMLSGLPTSSTLGQDMPCEYSIACSNVGNLLTMVPFNHEIVGTFVLHSYPMTICLTLIQNDKQEVGALLNVDVAQPANMETTHQFLAEIVHLLIQTCPSLPILAIGDFQAWSPEQHEVQAQFWQESLAFVSGSWRRVEGLTFKPPTNHPQFNVVRDQLDPSQLSPMAYLTVNTFFNYSGQNFGRSFVDYHRVEDDLTLPPHWRMVGLSPYARIRLVSFGLKKCKVKSIF